MLGMSNVFGGGVVTPMSLNWPNGTVGGSLQIGGFLYGSPLTGLLRGLDLSHYLPWTVTTLVGSASPGLQLRWSIWEGVIWSS